jgi:Rad3-related DNA helicase
VKNLADLGITKLTTIQAKALPVILGGKDALVKSQTGSGKTLTYAVPIIQVDFNNSLMPVCSRSVLRIRDVLSRIRGVKKHRIRNTAHDIVPDPVGSEPELCVKDRILYLGF